MTASAAPTVRAPEGLSPDPQPAGRGATDRVRDVWAVLTSADPGLLRLRLGLRAVVALALAVTSGWLLGHAFRTPTIVAMLLSGIVAMMGSFGASSRAPRDAAVTVAGLPVVAVAAVGAGALLDGRRTATLVGFAVAMVLAVFVRRFGTRAFIYGMAGFFLYFFTVFTRTPLSGAPQALAVIAAASLCVLVTAAVLVPDRPEQLLGAALRAHDVRLTALLDDARGALTGELPAARVRRFLHAREFRVVEAGLIVEGHLAAVGDRPGIPAAALRQRLLATELAVQELGTAADRLAGATDLPDRARGALVAGLSAAARRDVAGVRRATGELDRASLDCREATASPDGRGATASPDGRADSTSPDGRDATGPAGGPEAPAGGAGVAGGACRGTCRLLLDAADALRHLADALLPASATARVPDHVGGYEPAVELMLGHLPGAVPSVADVIAGGASRRARLSANTRLCVQTAVAGTAAIVVGEAISGTRYYWAVLACFLALTGTATNGEVLVKGANRVLGTVAGLVAATVAVHLTGTDTAAILAVMAVCVFLGLYFFRVSYAVMAFAVTTVMGELYNVLAEFSDSLLVLRVVETAVGAVLAVVVVLVLLPVRTGDARAAAARAFTAALRALLADVAARAARPGRHSDLLLDTRRLDAQLHQLALVARPAAGATLLRMQGRRASALLIAHSQVAYRARLLADAATRLEPGSAPAVAAASDRLADRLAGAGAGAGAGSGGAAVTRDGDRSGTGLPPPAGDAARTAADRLADLAAAVDRLPRQGSGPAAVPVGPAPAPARPGAHRR